MHSDGKEVAPLARGPKSFRDSDQSPNSLVQGLDLVLLQLESAQTRSLHQNRKRTRGQTGAWLLPGATNVLSVPESVQAAAPPGLFF